MNEKLSEYVGLCFQSFQGWVTRLASTLLSLWLTGLLLFTISPALAEDTDSPEVKVQPKAPTSAGESAAGSVADSQEEVVEPLDPWVPAAGASPIATAAPVAPAAQREAAPVGLTEEEYIEQEAAVKLETAAPEYTKAVKSIDPNEVAQQPRRIKLSKAQLARLKAIRKLRSKYIRQQYREMGVERRGIDPRGKAEIRICSLSVNHYGSVEDYKKTFGKAKLTERRRIEQSILRQITASKCNLVGIQGFLAPDTVLGTEALNRLAKKLTKMAGGEWQGILGGTVKDSPRNAFLVETEAVRVEQSESVKDFRFVRFGPFELEKMSRLPIKLRVTVKGKDGASDRELLVVNAQMREMFSAKDADSVSAQMQMADGIRQVLRSTKRALEDLEEPPTIVLLVDRQEDANSPSTKILDGRLRLVDFTQSGGCSLEEGKKVVCEPPPGRPADLIGITGSSYDVVPRRITKKVDGVKKVFLRYPKEETLKAERKKVLSRLGEIYLYSEETPLANLNDKQSGKYSAGVTKVYTGQKNSPLVWVDLNW